MEEKVNGMNLNINDPFLNSVDRMKADDIVITSTANKKKFSTAFLIRMLLVLVFLGIFLYSAYMLVDRAFEYGRSDSLYDSIADIWNDSEFGYGNPFGEVEYASKDGASDETLDYDASQTVVDKEETTIQMGTIDSAEMIALKTKINALKAQNKDFMGWIKIDNTIIDYPFVLGEDNSYYLSHAFDHTYSLSGTVFADYRNSADLDENYNTILYGHNLLSGKMFSDLEKYFTKSFFLENKYVYLYTEQGVYVYEVFNVARVSVNLDYIRTSFRTGNDFIEFAYKMKAQSKYSTDVTFLKSDRILTLSTCTNNHNDAERYCIQAKLVEIRK